MPSGVLGSKRQYVCIHCGVSNNWGNSIRNKFCNNSCQADYKWINETVPRIERGECTSNSVLILKKYLIEKYGNKCSECPVCDIWNDKLLVLQLDHVDGDSDNNFPSNLRLLCPNCHSQTNNFGSKGLGSRYKKIAKRNKYLQEYKNNASVV